MLNQFRDEMNIAYAFDGVLMIQIAAETYPQFKLGKDAKFETLRPGYISADPEETTLSLLNCLDERLIFTRTIVAVEGLRCKTVDLPRVDSLRRAVAAIAAARGSQLVVLDFPEVGKILNEVDLTPDLLTSYEVVIHLQRAFQAHKMLGLPMGSEALPFHAELFESRREMDALMAELLKDARSDDYKKFVGEVLGNNRDTLN